MYLIIMLDILLLRPSLHFTTLHATTLHSTSVPLSTLHFLSFQLHPTTLHYPLFMARRQFKYMCSVSSLYVDIMWLCSDTVGLLHLWRPLFWSRSTDFVTWKYDSCIRRLFSKIFYRTTFLFHSSLTTFLQCRSCHNIHTCFGFLYLTKFLPSFL